ncbi:hypothetical protein BKA66DRAFT_408947 [Pyrenochaeta sp. MPI-SDFR-AT-0127]|nr:hypothetical protein BKA66DRAFT_408947 [Pyrenochaeta sp. MPI-SDFR-AT-0127]
MAKFQDMPAEFRNVLYTELLKKGTGYHRSRNELALFSVSKQLHTESTSYFYQNNDITIDAPSLATDTATILPPIADKYLRFLRNLGVHTITGQANWPGVRKAASTITSIATLDAQLDELNVFISSPLSQLLNSRVDDSVMDRCHPITIALQNLVASGVAKSICIELRNAWFAPGVASSLHPAPSSQLRFSISDKYVLDLDLLERPVTGRYSSMHLTDLGLREEDVRDAGSCLATSLSSAPSSLPSSLCSAFADLDTFSVTTFEFGADDELDKNGESYDDFDTSEQPFFTEDEIEEWQASTHESSQEDLSGAEGPTLGEDDEMEDVPQQDIQAFMNNLEETAHHHANEADMNYMTNFAPDLLLSRHHLGHLV